jgi:hypothetical protein
MGFAAIGVILLFALRTSTDERERRIFAAPVPMPAPGRMDNFTAMERNRTLL